MQTNEIYASAHVITDMGVFDPLVYYMHVVSKTRAYLNNNDVDGAKKLLENVKLYHGKLEAGALVTVIGPLSVYDSHDKIH